MEEWKEWTLGDISSFSQGIQVDIDNQFLENRDEYIRFVRIVDYTKNSEPPRYIKKTKKQYIVDASDLVMIRYGSQTAGRIVRGIQGAIANNMFKISLKAKINNEYLYYYLTQKKVFDFLRNSQSSSTMPAITFELASRIPILLPSLSTQEKIASILSSLDDKMECNRKINENLEQQAQALFKSWFVDFEPFKDGNFVESELGTIPKGWKVLQFKDFLETSTEKALCTVYPEYSVTNNGIIPRDAKFKKRLSDANSKNKVLRRDDLVFGMSREILNWGIMQDEIGGVSSAYHVYHIRKNIMSPLYLNMFMKSKEYYFKDLIGTAAREGQSLDRGAMFEKNIYYPPTTLLDSFIGKYNSLMDLFHKNLKESERLTQLRDTLLPKLMSGEITIND